MGCRPQIADSSRVSLHKAGPELTLGAPPGGDLDGAVDRAHQVEVSKSAAEFQSADARSAASSWPLTKPEQVQVVQYVL